jgi:sentrin-specific protease 7
MIVIHFKCIFVLVVVSSDEEGPIEHKSSGILKLQPNQDYEIANENESTSESEVPLATCESAQVIYFCFLTY